MNTNAKFLNETKQLDTYYQPSYRKFLKSGEINEWLRIGKRGNKIILNYKNWHDNMYCDEYEVELDNDENDLEKKEKDKTSKLVDKKRKTYLYLDKYEIALDYVQDLGYFIEIEVKKYKKDITKCHKA